MTSPGCLVLVAMTVSRYFPSVFGICELRKRRKNHGLMSHDAETEPVPESPGKEGWVCSYV